MSFYPIDLSQYCNHKLVYSGVQEGDDDSVGLDGEYIDEKDLKIKPNDEIGGVPFRFVFGDFDNVQCDGQTIKVDQFANRLHVLALHIGAIPSTSCGYGIATAQKSRLKYRLSIGRIKLRRITGTGRFSEKTFFRRVI